MPAFPIVGIGASAGGLAAFEAFFSGMPAETEPGMAFVLVQHLDPNHDSILTDLIRRYTRMQVFEVTDETAVQPNCVYIIPPNRDMAFLNGTLQLLEPSAPRGQRLPIDFFFRSLAMDQHERAIGIVLSGTGSDGTLGVRAIKAEGGMVMVQTPASTEYDGMPRSALATGLVDYELLAVEMAAQLIAYATHAFGKPSRPATVTAPKDDSAIKKVFVLLRAQTSHEFSQYKPSTVYRRIARRMAVNQIEQLDDYVKYLQQTPAEIDALFRDLLIGVTSFFRDPEEFTALEAQIIPKLFECKPAGGVIRVWSPGCSTGEEAYSLAILLAEAMEALKKTFKVQVFATDIDSQAIAVARAGLYPASIAADVSAERLARFFTLETTGSTYRIHKAIRDMLVFSEQNVIKDPPFSRLDLISCRNLLIYLDGSLQKKLMPMFHYALNSGGYLFLGTSETVGECDDLFSPLDRKAKLYQRTQVSRISPPAAPVPFELRLPAIQQPPLRQGNERQALYMSFPTNAPLRELAERALLQQLVQAGALVNSQGDILYIHGRTGMYLEMAPGEAGINNILKTAREGLQSELTVALHKATATRDSVFRPGLSVKTNGHITTVDLTIHPVAAADAPLYLVILVEVPKAVGGGDGGSSPSNRLPEGGGPPPPHAGTATESASTAETRIAALEQVLRDRNEYIQATHEELETSNEELKSSNEEMQSVNEELQSSNEELETSKEELQSVNEELATVNTELQTKVADLSQANNDMNNLLAGINIATIFLNHQLRILRFTPSVARIVNLLMTDVGRPLTDIRNKLVHWDSMEEDMQTVLHTLIPREANVRTTDGDSYAMRIAPYRTLDNVIEGVVLTFWNITDIVRAREALRESEKRYSAIFEQSPIAIEFYDASGCLLNMNRTCIDLFGIVNVNDVAGLKLFEDPNITGDIKARLLKQESVRYEMDFDFEEVNRLHLYKTTCAGKKTLDCSIAPLTEGPVLIGYVLQIQDITERRRTEEALRKAGKLTRLAAVVHDSRDAITVQDMEGRIIAWNPGAERMYGWSEAEALAMNARDRIPEGLREDALAKLHQLGRADVLEPYRTQRLTKDGKVVDVSIISTALLNEAGQMYAIATTERAGGVL